MSPTSEQDFFARLRRSGMLVRTRFSTRNPSEITGYAVALPGDITGTGAPVWYGGGKLAADLTLPKLRYRWRDANGGPNTPPGAQFTWAERNAVWEHAARAAATAADDIRFLTATDPAAAADAAWAASDTLHAAAAVLGGRVIRQAADAYDRAARMPYGRVPQTSRTGTDLRRTARLLSRLGAITHDPSLAAITLVVRLAALAETIADLRRAQQHAAQAAAARAAAAQLHSLTRPPSPPPPRGPRRQRHTPPRTAAELAALAFPAPPLSQEPAVQSRASAPSPVGHVPTAHQHAGAARPSAVAARFARTRRKEISCRAAPGPRADRRPSGPGRLAVEAPG